MRSDDGLEAGTKACQDQRQNAKWEHGDDRSEQYSGHGKGPLLISFGLSSQRPGTKLGKYFSVGVAVQRRPIDPVVSDAGPGDRPPPVAGALLVSRSRETV